MKSKIVAQGNTKLTQYKKRFKCAHNQTLEVEELVPHPNNPNNHPERQIELLAKIIKYQGQRAPIVVSKRSGFITKGHARLAALKLLGWEHAAVDEQEYKSEAMEWADIVADNKIAELAEHDDKLAISNAEKLEIKDFELLGMDLPIETLDPKADEDAVPEPPKEPITKRGDVWLLGNHRVMCGDSTMIDDVEKLMKGAKADMVFTDPPYGMNYSGRGKETSNKILNDNIDPTDFYNIGQDITERYIWGRVENYKNLLIEPRDTIIWRKNNFGMGRGYRGQYECCFYYGDFNGSDSDVWDVKKDHKYEHPTQKPVELCERAIKNSNPKTVIDYFLGSGSTLIACEKTSRKCYGMELDEHYCDVIVKRWEDYTGKKAELCQKEN
ncbi:MAG: DNA modification methylase [Pseudoalteromonas sp.]